MYKHKYCQSLVPDFIFVHLAVVNDAPTTLKAMIIVFTSNILN